MQKAARLPTRKKIEGKLRRLVDEFGVQPSEAERSVTNELAKEYNLPAPGSGGSPAGGKGRRDGREEDSRRDSWRMGNHRGKSRGPLPPASSSIAQSGIIADESGAIRFVVWAKSNAPAMAEGSWYRIESAVVDEFKGVANLKIHSGTTIRDIIEDRPLIPTPIPIKDLHRDRLRAGEVRPGVGRIP